MLRAKAAIWLGAMNPLLILHLVGGIHNEALMLGLMLVFTLGIGMASPAALARAVILSPDVILADEPTGNLDWDMSLRLLQLLVELNRSGKTVLLATHDLNLIRAAKSHVQARVLRIAGKRLQAAGADL